MHVFVKHLLWEFYTSRAWGGGLTIQMFFYNSRAEFVSERWGQNS